jgi:hypothetical protein
MKILKYLILALFFCFLINYANSQTSDTNSMKPYRTLPNSSFSYGERLSFEISYGFLTAAEAFMNISPAPVSINGRETFEINFDVNSRSSFDLVYKVRDNYKTYIDSKGLFPWKFEQHIRENAFKRDVEVVFLQDSLKVQTKTDNANLREFQVPAFVQDILSSFYYARTLDFRNYKEGDILTVQYFYDDKYIPLDIRFEGREEVEVSSGKYRTFVVKPELKEGFTSKTSDIYIWLSDDDRKIPVQVKMKIVIGSLVAELTDYSGLNGPLNAKIE